MMRILCLLGLLVGIALPPLPLTAATAETDPDQLVAKADAIRFPSEAFQVAVLVTTTAPGRDPEVHQYQVLQKGHDNSVVRTLAPASERGQIMLLRGADLWIFLP